MRRHLSFFWPIYVMGIIFALVLAESWRESYPFAVCDTDMSCHEWAKAHNINDAPGYGAP